MEKVDETFWKAIFLVIILGAVTLIISLSVFFYIRSREALWDNRSGVSRLIVINKNSQNPLGTETFTMFGSEEITLNGDAIQDGNTMYIAEGGIILLEISGVSRGSTTGGVSTYTSRVLVSRKDTSSVSPLDPTATSISPVEVELNPVTGTDGAIRIKLEDSRIELRGSWDTISNPIRSYALRTSVVGWYP